MWIEPFWIRPKVHLAQHAASTRFQRDALRKARNQEMQTIPLSQCCPRQLVFVDMLSVITEVPDTIDYSFAWLSSCPVFLIAQSASLQREAPFSCPLAVLCNSCSWHSPIFFLHPIPDWCYQILKLSLLPFTFPASSSATVLQNILLLPSSVYFAASLIFRVGWFITFWNSQIQDGTPRLSAQTPPLHIHTPYALKTSPVLLLKKFFSIKKKINVFYEWTYYINTTSNTYTENPKV